MGQRDKKKNEIKGTHKVKIGGTKMKYIGKRAKRRKKKREPEEERK